VHLAELLARRGYVRIAGDRVETTSRGTEWAVGNGFLPMPGSAGSKRAASAGRVPTAILRHLLESGHLRRGAERALHLNMSGKAWFDVLDAPLPAPPATRRKTR
jgi:hypothetical protein